MQALQQGPPQERRFAQDVFRPEESLDPQEGVVGERREFRIPGIRTFRIRSKRPKFFPSQYLVEKGMQVRRIEQPT